MVWLTRIITGGFAFQVGMNVILSPEDEDLLQYKMHKSSSGYWMLSASKLLTNANVSRSEYVHRIILQRVLLVLPPANLLVADHINSNRADCRRENLRMIPQHQNILRKFKKCTNKLGYWRVGRTTNGKFEVLFKLDCVTNHFGGYETLEEAAFWSDVYSFRLQAEEAPLNFPERLDEIRDAALSLHLPQFPWRRDPYANIP